MNRCSRCNLIHLSSEYEMFCNDCGHWIEARQAEVHDERVVMGFEAVCSWVASGSQPETREARWVVR